MYGLVFSMDVNSQLTNFIAFKGKTKPWKKFSEQVMLRGQNIGLRVVKDCPWANKFIYVLLRMDKCIEIKHKLFTIMCFSHCFWAIKCWTSQSHTHACAHSTETSTNLEIEKCYKLLVMIPRIISLIFWKKVIKGISFQGGQ